MRFLLVTYGSHGDIHPFVAIAQALIARGHRAVVATNPSFGGQIERAGVEFAPLGERMELDDVMKTPGVMSTWGGSRVVLKQLTLPLTRVIYPGVTALIESIRPDAIVNHPICFGAPWAAEKAGVPVVTAALAPISWMRAKDPIVFGPWRSARPRLYETRLDAWIGRWIMRGMLDGSLNAIRREYGLPKGRDLLVGEFVRPGLNLGLWSPAFRGPAAGDPVGGVICGFPWFDAHHAHDTGADAERLENFLRAGEPPIVFSLGTAAVHTAGDFYWQAAQAAARLKKRAVLLMGRQRYIDEMVSQHGALPPGVIALAYARFSTLMPRAAMNVVHGGIGSTAQALRAGKPVGVVPLAHDQWDNAARCVRLEVGTSLAHSRATAERLASAIGRVIDDAAVQRRAREIGRVVMSEDGGAAAAGALESAVQGGVWRRAASA